MLSPTTLDKLLRTQKVLDRFSDATGRLVSWLTLAMMFITATVVIMRYLLNTGSIALQESITYMHGMVFLLAIAYTLKQQAHVRVDIIYQKLSPRSQAIVDLLGAVFFLLPFCLFLLWVSYDYVIFSWSLLESSPEPGGLPAVFLLKTLIPIMALLLLLQGIAEIIRNFLVLQLEYQGLH
jgi:TRAP-type mannitol/chloroaromatic compound transport system permease small subunit